MRTLARFAGALTLRAWVAFSALAIVGFAVFLRIDGDDPLESDDPYLLGFVFGGIAAGSAGVYTVAEGIARRAGRLWLRDLIYGAVLAAWCLFLWIGSRGGGEGAGILAYAVVASLIVGVLVYPLCRFRLPWLLIAVLSCASAGLLVMYCVVCERMAQRSF